MTTQPALIPAPKTRRPWIPGAAVGLLLLATVATTGCDLYSKDWHWTLGRTHGAIIETTAGRASLGVYRVPTVALYKVLRGPGLGTVQELLWHFGQPPELKRTFSFRGRSVTISFGAGTAALRRLAHRVIFDHDSDLRDALRATHANRNCLAVTLISYGTPTVNWTNKHVGCKDGSL